MAAIKLDKATLSSAADAARRKTGHSAPLSPRKIAEEVGMIPAGDRAARDAEWITRTLKTVIFPEGITEIGDYVFDGCSELRSTELPETVTKIGEGAFRKCSALALKKLPDRLEEANMAVFYGCKALEVTSLPEEMKTVHGGYDNGAFQKSGIAISSLPESMETVGGYAFAGCDRITELRFPRGPLTLSGRSFYICRNLSKVTFTDSNITLGSAFEECPVLRTINVPWAEGEVAGAPWGAGRATINYNYKEEQDDEGNAV